MDNVREINGVFEEYREKVISEKSTLYLAVFLIDNRRPEKMDDRDIQHVPFQTFGKSKEVAQNLRAGQQCKISFTLGGWKDFSKISAIAIYPVEDQEYMKDAKARFEV